MTEYAEEEKYPAPGFSFPDGKPAHLLSSANPKTVDRHFRWMEQYRIDGVFLQRFLVSLKDRSVDQVLVNVQQSANRTGRTFALCYDLTGVAKDRVYDLLVADWKRLVDETKITQDGRYLRHNRRPVLFVWGFYSDRFGPNLANRIIDFFKNDQKLHHKTSVIRRLVEPLAALFGRSSVCRFQVDRASSYSLDG